MRTYSGIGLSAFEDLGQNFSQYHKDPINVFLHLITTPLGILGAASALRAATNSSSAVACVIFVYLLSLLPFVPIGVFIGTLFLSVAIGFLTKSLQLNIYASLALIVAGYALQDLSHYLVGEMTFQSSYTEGNPTVNFTLKWRDAFVDHVYYLLPLCVHITLPILQLSDQMGAILNSPIPFQMQQVHTFAWILAPLVAFALGSYCLDSKNTFCFFPGAPYFYRVLQCSLLSETTPGESRQKQLTSVRVWAMSNNPPEEKSSHWWYKDLPADARDAFNSCARAPQIFRMFRSLFSERHYCVDVVEGMNEIYVTGPARSSETSNSDHVFYSRHVDGPWGIFPFVSVYRCIVGMDKNYMITTHFPLANVDVNACAGDVLAFDFNREVHYITCDESKRSISDDFRVTLKLHYCVYPRILAPLGWFMHYVNVQYNILFRALFLRTISPASLYEHFLAWNVVANTKFYDRVETIFGIRNLLYLAFAATLWWATGSYSAFYVLTSYVHYVRYITTFYIRRGIDFGSFKRDVLLFKTCALVQIAFHYVCPAPVFSPVDPSHAPIQPFSFDPISVFMIVSGYAVSIMATNALGIDRTYFAAELGLVEPKWITQFPYGYIPHPMIISQIWALLGFFKAAHFRQEYPYLVPIHIAFYVVHMLQEHFNVYKRYPHSTAAVPLGAVTSKREEEDVAGAAGPHEETQTEVDGTSRTKSGGRPRRAAAVVAAAKVSEVTGGGARKS